MTPLFIHNTLSGKKEKFHPEKKAKKGPGVPTVTMYSCGPTVYDSVHIGNLRTFVMNDMVRRVLEYKGYSVNHAMNITDVDDKTIRRSSEEGVTLEELTAKYEELFWRDMASLNNLRPKQVLGARAHIGEMIKLTEVLLKKGVAYVAKDGVYMSVMKVKKYGELAGLDLKKLKPNSAGDDHERIANDEYDKENPRDFAVWKFSFSDGETVAWDAPFGRGRPGWHIECSAMAMGALGKTIDIHTGGIDLIFPHHTNEIAQSQSATKKTFVNYWVHGGFMNVQDEKMAKSKGNFLKLSDLTAEHISPLAFRYWLLTAHYRSQVNFSLEAVRAAQTALFKLCEAMIGWTEEAMRETGRNDADMHVHGTKKSKEVQKYLNNFDAYISDDFNMPRAVALLWKAVKDPELSPAEKRRIVLDFDKVFALRLSELSPAADNPDVSDAVSTHSEIPPEIIALAEAREIARVSRDFQKADALRLEVESRGYRIKDSAKGFKIVE